MSDVTINHGPVRDEGTGEYPMTRPAEVTVENPVSNVSTGEVPAPPAEVTVDAVDPTQSTGEYPTAEAQPVQQWPGHPTADTQQAAAGTAAADTSEQPAKKASAKTKRGA